MKRRPFLALLSAAPAVLRPALAAEPRLSEITVRGIEIFRVRVNRLGNWVIARVQTSAGLSGRAPQVGRTATSPTVIARVE